MELLLIRHALPVRHIVTDGAADPPLSDAGRAQAQHLADYLAHEELHAIYTSPMRRAIETAVPLVEGRGVEPVIVDEVAEWDRNDTEYVPMEELRAANDPRWQAMLRGEWLAHEESPEQFVARVVGALERVIAAHSGQRIAVVCHGGVIYGYLGHVLGLPMGQAFFYPNYTSIHRVAAARSGERSIVTINETSHLRRTGLPMGLFQVG